MLSKLRLVLFLLVVVAAAAGALTVGSGVADAQSSVRPPNQDVEAGPQDGNVPGGVSGNVSDSEFWREIRHGMQGQVSIPDKKAGVLVQAEGELFRNFRNGPLQEYGAWALLVIVVVLALFFLLRGRIRVEHGLAHRTVRRFSFIERFAHWLTAGPFVILGLTGLNVLYGKQVLLPVIGPKAFAALTYYGKFAHDLLGFAFILGVLLMIVLWARDNIPTLRDLRWLMVGGGLFTKGLHPPAAKFNAGQKLIFWAVVVLGLSLGVTGLCLIFPFEFAPFAGTFKVLHALGLDVPTELTPLQETQLALLWHGIVALAAVVVIIAHIYIGTLGMEGAIDAMTSGDVDVNWAREHHSLWLQEIEGPTNRPRQTAPAE